MVFLHLRFLNMSVGFLQRRRRSHPGSGHFRRGVFLGRWGLGQIGAWQFRSSPTSSTHHCSASSISGFRCGRPAFARSICGHRISAFSSNLESWPSVYIRQRWHRSFGSRSHGDTQTTAIRIWLAKAQSWICGMWSFSHGKYLVGILITFWHDAFTLLDEDYLGRKPAIQPLWAYNIVLNLFGTLISLKVPNKRSGFFGSEGCWLSYWQQLTPSFSQENMAYSTLTKYQNVGTRSSLA